MTDNKSKTPRTDIEKFKVVDAVYGERIVVEDEFAEGLERELSAANARIAELEKDLGLLYTESQQANKHGANLTEKIIHHPTDAFGVCIACASRYKYSYNPDLAEIEMRWIEDAEFYEDGCRII